MDQFVKFFKINLLPAEPIVDDGGVNFAHNGEKSSGDPYGKHGWVPYVLEAAKQTKIGPINVSSGHVSTTLRDATRNQGGFFGDSETTDRDRTVDSQGRTLIPDDDGEPEPKYYFNEIGDWQIPNHSPFNKTYYYSGCLDSQSMAFVDMPEHRHTKFKELRSRKSYTPGANLHHSFLQYGIHRKAV
jgi:hypothetical protein